LNAGSGVSTGNNLTVIGYNAQASSGSATNEITLGNSNIATIRSNTQTISSLSDERDKTEVEDLPLGMEFLRTLRPIKFKWQTRGGSSLDGSYSAGFIAQDLLQAQEMSDAEYLNMVLTTNPERLEASYGKLLPVVVQALKDIDKRVSNLEG